MSAKIEKTIARQKEKISEGNFYEAHQQLRVIATRYVKSKSYRLAIDILFGGALALLQAGQGSSGGDLCLYLIECFNRAELEVSPENKGKIFTLMRAFPPNEPTRKRFAGDAISWSSKRGEFVNGDPELHHVMGSLYAGEAEPYDAERHLALGTRDSPEILASMEYEWYSQDELHTAPLYAARAVLPYLLTRNLRSANKAHINFTSRLCSQNASLGVQDVSSSTADMRLYPSVPLLNFLGLLLLACQRRSAEMFRQLTMHYDPFLRELATWEPALSQIGEIWFGIQIPRQGNPLFDMVGSMLFGDNGNAGRSSRAQRSGASNTTIPAAELD